MIEYLTIEIEGFGSIVKPLKLDLKQSGITLMRGPNGSGKSTIWKALYWNQFGKSLTNVPASKIPTKKDYRGNNFKGTKVSVTQLIDSKKVEVIRCISYKGEVNGLHGGSNLFILVDGELINTQHKQDSQEFLNDLLKVDEKTFLTSILFGQEMKRFISGSPADKRTIFENIVDLTFLDDAKVNSKNKLSELNTQLLDLENEYTAITSEIESLESQIFNFNTQKSQVEDQFKAKIAASKKEIADYQNAKLTIREKLEVITDNYTEYLNEANRELTKVQTLKSSLKEPEDSCITCGTKVSKVKLKALQEEYQDSLADYSAEIEIISLKIFEITTAKDKFVEAEAYNASIDADITFNQKLLEDIFNCEKSIESYLGSIEELQSSDLLEGIKNSLEEAKESLPEVQSKLNNIEKLVEIVSWWDKVGFSSKGLKGYLINNALQKLNDLVQQYASLLGYQITFSIDIEKASKPFKTLCTIGGVVYDYEEFSGGEKRRLDIATAFALNDFVSHTQDFNLLIIDEMFDGTDDEGKEDCFHLLNEKAKTKSIFIISHSEYFNSLNTNILNIYKTDSTYAR